MKKLRFFILGLVWLCLAWVGITGLIYRVKHQDMTETQLFINLPKAIFLNFND